MIVIIALLAFLGALLVMSGLTSTKPSDLMNSWLGR